MNRIGLFVATVLIVLMIASSTLFIVDQKSVGVVYALGEIKEVITEPGLKAKLPPPFQNVVFLDRRNITHCPPKRRFTDMLFFDVLARFPLTAFVIVMERPTRQLAHDGRSLALDERELSFPFIVVPVRAPGFDAVTLGLAGEALPVRREGCVVCCRSCRDEEVHAERP